MVDVDRATALMRRVVTARRIVASAAHEDRDTYLLGAVALAAAIEISYQRGAS